LEINMYKFNGGRGAVICDQCKKMIDADISYKEYEECYEKINSAGDYCLACSKGYKKNNKDINPNNKK